MRPPPPPPRGGPPRRGVTWRSRWRPHGRWPCSARARRGRRGERCQRWTRRRGSHPPSSPRRGARYRSLDHEAHRRRRRRRRHDADVYAWLRNVAPRQQRRDQRAARAEKGAVARHRRAVGEVKSDVREEVAADEEREEALAVASLLYVPSDALSSSGRPPSALSIACTSGAQPAPKARPPRAGRELALGVVGGEEQRVLEEQSGHAAVPVLEEEEERLVREYLGVEGHARLDGEDGPAVGGRRRAGEERSNHSSEAAARRMRWAGTVLPLRTSCRSASSAEPASFLRSSPKEEVVTSREAGRRHDGWTPGGSPSARRSATASSGARL